MDSWLGEPAHNEIPDYSPNYQIVNHRPDIEDWTEPVVWVCTNNEPSGRATDERMNVAEWKTARWAARAASVDEICRGRHAQTDAKH